MIKRLAKYLNGLWLLCLISASGMIVEAVCEMALPSIANLVYNRVSEASESGEDVRGYVVKIGLAMFGMALFGLAGGLATMKSSSVAATRFSYRLRRDLFEKISAFSFKNIDTFSTSSLTTRMTNDVTTLQNTLLMTLRILVRAPALLIVSAFFAFSINWRVSLVLVVLFPFVVIIVALVLKFGFPMFKAMQKKIDKVNQVVQENLIGIRVVKAYVREEREKEKFHAASDDLAKQGAKAAGLVVTVMPVMMLLLNVVIVYIYAKGAHDAAKGFMDVGQISVLTSYIVQVLMNIVMVSIFLLQLTRAKACGDRITEVLDTESDIVNPPQAFVPAHPQGAVSFDHVSFGYHEEDEVLEDITFSVPAGAIVGIIGSTGCGKSSLVNLIPRLYDVHSGSVKVDGVDVRDYDLEALRGMIGVVLQKNVLFSGTIKENIRWGKADATDEEIVAACRSAQADAFIREQPDGYETDLSQGGLNLSGGQKQRLCIARAMIKQPKILILDDSTSAVDTATEAKIRDSFYNEFKDTTVIIIAQRITSVMEADTILVLDDGKIEAIGNHEALLASSEVYREIYKTQQKGVLE